MVASNELHVVSPEEIRQQSRAVGFDLCGIAPAGALPELAFLRDWLDRGYAGDMTYMHESANRRADVREVLPSAESVIVLGTVYNVDRPYSTEEADRSRAAIARYAWGDDYHAVIRRRMARLLEWLRKAAGEGFEALAYVDTGPVQERVYAQHAGIGWIGKNTCVINAERGSWIFLSEIICNLPLEPDAPALDQCGTCSLCLEACPTGALVEPRVLDSTRCLSYLTIELKGGIPPAQRRALSRHAYGCDICQEVCPWNLTPSTAISSDPSWLPRAGLDGPHLLDLWRRSDDELRRLLKGSAMKRAGAARLRRNLAIAIGNTGGAEAIEALESQDDATGRDPIVAEHVTWAIAEIDARKAGVRASSPELAR
ncbi:MAG TPA: tRNA epoxyqueuosine(34) reductase QueG [Vicinamibacterales bacterium]|nr:tRNA epoxyqueuosine(34) reductase QueG [Vicinamibacterales bacterium]